jgi:hypothetical protein
MMAMLFAHWFLRRSGCHKDHPLPYCWKHDFETLLTPSIARPYADGEKLETPDVVPFVQM